MRRQGGRDDQLAEMEAMLELQSDAVLKPYPGIYSEKGLTVKMRKHDGQAQDIEMVAAHSRSMLEVAAQEMTEALFVDLVRVAHLGDRDAQVVEWRRAGWTYPEIGEALRISDDAARKAFMRARVRILKALIAHPYYGLMEVYLSEIHRRK